MVEIGSVGLRIFLCMMPLIAFQAIGASYFQAVGKANYTIVLNLLRQVIVLISDFISTVVTVVLLFREINRLKKENPRGQQSEPG
ncbi:MAG: multi antimicrobial extrusion protein ((+)/drug antiporter), family of efflux p [Firmicutes bacterium]|nr:multi antimicrobial extrusion protein ((+)/drug antiporter), family of efflux p [Bacillota bacterium]